jgi:hypothetical protein
MRECVKVVLGVLALTVGASAPTLIIEALRPGGIMALHRPFSGNEDTHHSNRQPAQDGSGDKFSGAQIPQSKSEQTINANPKHEGEWYANPDWWVAGFTAALWFFTALLWLATRRTVVEAQATAEAANTHARAAEEANRINRQILIAANRPWITVRMAIPDGAPLIFTADRITTRIKITAKNIGRSPATNINFSIEFYADMVTANKRLNSITFKDAVGGSLTGFGRMLIPDEDFSEERNVHISANEFKNAIREGALHEIGDDESLDQGCPAVLAAVWYNVPADRLPRWSIIVREIRNTEPRQFGFNGTEGEFPNVEIVESFVSARVT